MFFGQNSGPVKSIVDEVLSCICLVFKGIGLLISVLGHPVRWYGVPIFNFIFPILICCYFITLNVLIAEVILVAEGSQYSTGQGCFQQEFEGSAEDANLKVDLEATMKGSGKDGLGHVVLSNLLSSPDEIIPEGNK